MQGNNIADHLHHTLHKEVRDIASKVITNMEDETMQALMDAARKKVNCKNRPLINRYQTDARKTAWSHKNVPRKKETLHPI